MSPERIAHYQVVRRLGAGGMGEVYLARDTRLDRTVALKVLPPELAREQDRMRRFVREAKAASALSHPNVAQIYEIGDAEGVTFIAMEYVDGEGIDKKIAGGPLRPAEVTEIAIEVADALDEAHSKGITHRDIKPANVMISARGRVKVLDFGLAKVTRPSDPSSSQEAATQTKTDLGVVLGTVQYMSPEQALGREVDHRTDLFSLGAMLYEVATGRLPFSGGTPGETIDRIVHAEPQPIARLNEAIPVELDRIVRKCLEKDRDRRYQSARELLVDLRNLKRDSDPASSPAHPSWTEPGGPGLLRRASVFFGLNPRRWWEMDLLACIAFTPVVIYLGWIVKEGPPRATWGLATFFAVLLCQVVSNVLRLHLAVVTVFNLRGLAAEVRRTAPLTRVADLLLAATLAVMAADIAEARTGLAAVLLGLGVALVVRIFIAEPTMIREAFPGPDAPRAGRDEGRE